MTVTAVVIGALGIVTKGLVQRLEDLEIKGLLEKIETTSLMRSDRILTRLLETLEENLAP